MQICRKCGTRLSVFDEGQQFHPLCTPEWEKLPGAPMSVAEMEVREELLEALHWKHAESPRSKQVFLGCSEAGSACDLKIAYRMAGQKTVNFPDTLKADMGTAFHHWVDDAVLEFQATLSSKRWLTETPVWPAKFLKGHVDLYDRVKRLVLDWKTTSAEVLREWRKSGIPQGYKTQIMLYGKGMLNLGNAVDRVGIIAVSRSGTYRDVAVLTIPYDDDYAVSALRRIWNIGKQISELSVTTQPGNYAKVSKAPSFMECQYCPFYRGGTAPPDGTGCPGKTTGDPVADLFG